MASVEDAANSHAEAPSVFGDAPLPPGVVSRENNTAADDSQSHLVHAVLHEHGSSKDTLQDFRGGEDLSSSVAEVEELEELCAPLSELEENVWSLRAAFENAYKVVSHKSGSDANITFIFKDDSIAQLTLGKMGCDSFMAKTRGLTIDDWGYYTTLARIKWADKQRANPSDVNGKQHAFDVALEELRQDLKAHGFDPDSELLQPPERPGDALPKKGKKKERKWRKKEKNSKSIKMVEKSLYLEGFSYKNGAFNNAFFESSARALLRQHQQPASGGGGQLQQEDGEREPSDSGIAQKIKAGPSTVSQTFQCRSKAKFDAQQRRNHSQARSVLVKNNHIAAHQVHDLKVLCKLVEKIKGSPGARWTDLWGKSESNGIRLLFLHELQDSYLKRVAGLDDTLLDEAFNAIEHVRAFADSRMRAAKNGVLTFDQELVQRGLIALRALHEAASLWAANASVPVPEVGDLMFKGRPSSSGKEVPEGCTFSIIIKRFSNSPRVLVELRHANTQDDSFGHHCSIATNVEEQRRPMETEDLIREHLEMGADHQKICTIFNERCANFKKSFPGVELPRGLLVTLKDVASVSRKYRLDGRLAVLDEEDAHLRVKRDRIGGFYRVYKPYGEAWDDSSKLTHGLHLLRRPRGAYLEPMQDLSHVFIAMASDAMVRSLREYGEYLLFDATHSVTTARGLKLFTIFGINSMGIGVELLYAIINHETTAVVERIFAVLSNLHGDPSYKPKYVMCDMAAGPIKAVHRMWHGVRVQYCSWHVLRAFRGRLDRLKRGSRDAATFRNDRQKVWMLLQDAVVAETEQHAEDAISAADELLKTFEDEPTRIFFRKYFSDFERRLWSAAYRRDCLDASGHMRMTNMTCESWHSTLKTVYFRNRRNRRLARLLQTLEDRVHERLARVAREDAGLERAPASKWIFVKGQRARLTVKEINEYEDAHFNDATNSGREEMVEENLAGAEDLDNDDMDVGLDEASIDEHPAIDDLPSSRLRLRGSFRTLEEATGERNRAAHFRENVLSQMRRFIAQIESLPLDCPEPRASLFQKHLNDLAAESCEMWAWLAEQYQSVQRIDDQDFLDPDSAERPESELRQLPRVQRGRREKQPRKRRHCESSENAAISNREDEAFPSVRNAAAEARRAQKVRKEAILSLKPLPREDTRTQRLIQFAQEQRDRHHRNQPFAMYMTSQRGCAGEILAEIEERELAHLPPGQRYRAYVTSEEPVEKLKQCLTKELTLDETKLYQDRYCKSSLTRLPSGVTLFKVGETVIRDYDHFTSLYDDEPDKWASFTFRKLYPAIPRPPEPSPAS